MSAFVTPVLLTVGIACVAAIMLALASKFFAVPVDEKQIAIRECLSGANAPWPFCPPHSTPEPAGQSGLTETPPSGRLLGSGR